MKFNRLSIDEREEISRMLSQGFKNNQIASILQRDKSTISREINRCKDMSEYRAYTASIDARGKRRKCGRKVKLDVNIKLRCVVLKWLKIKWSPVQIMESLKREYPEDETMRISYESIYKYMYVHPKEKLRREMISGLRRVHKVRHKQRTVEKDHKEKRGHIPNMVSIDERPKEIEGRLIEGHWEGDLMLGGWKRSALGTLSERKTRFTILVRLPERDPESVRKAFQKAFKKLPQDLKRTLTYDQGKEMMQHEIFTQKSKVQVYFAHKSSPWERGTNENTNGLLRQYFPKGTDFGKVTDRQVKKVQDELNGRPRQCLKFLKPIEVFNLLLQ